MTVNTHLDPVEDAQGHPTLGYRISNHVDVRVLAASTSENHVVPSGAKHCAIRADADLWIHVYGTTASIPTVDNTAGGSSWFIPANVLELIEVDDSTEISMISASAAKVCMGFYK